MYDLGEEQGLSVEVTEHYNRLCCGTCLASYRSGFMRCPTDGTELVEFQTDPMIGITLADHYVIEECIGEGAMGRVYRAHHSRLERRLFAIKVLLGDLAAEPTMRKRFAQEADAASRLSHPNLVGVLDYGETPAGLLYLVMELVHGDNLADVIERDGAMPQERVVEIAKQLCLGLAHAHDRDLVHRDFKPDNVVMTPRETGPVPRILDFGLAIVADPETASTRLTQAGLVMGTPAYTSPEAAMAKPIDARSDLFALGVSLYELLAGQLPFDGSVMEMVYANARDEPPPIMERSPGVIVSPGLQRIVLRLMAKSPAERFATARDVLDALNALAEPAEGASSGALAAVPVTPGVAPAAPIPAGADAGSPAATLPVSRTQAFGSAGSKKAAGKAAAVLAADPLAPTSPGMAPVRVAGQEVEQTQSIRAEPRSRRGLAIVLVVFAAAAAFALYWTVLRGGGSSGEGTTQTAPASIGTGADGTPPAVPVASAAAATPGIKGQGPRAVLATAPQDDTTKTEPSIDAGSPPSKRPSESKPSQPKPSQAKPSPRRRTPRGSVAKSTRVVVAAATPREPPAAAPKPVPADSASPGSIVTTPPIKPTPIKIAPPAPVPPPPPRAPPTPKPRPALDATTSIKDFSARGSLSRTIVRRAVDRVATSFRSCYRSSAKRLKRDAAGTVKVQFKIDERGRAQSVKTGGGPLPGVASCVASAVKKVRSRIAPDVGTVRVSFSIRFVPRKL